MKSAMDLIDWPSWAKWNTDDGAGKLLLGAGDNLILSSLWSQVKVDQHRGFKCSCPIDKISLILL
jgi:hypothetical protein